MFTLALQQSRQSLSQTHTDALTMFSLLTGVSGGVCIITHCTNGLQRCIIISLLKDCFHVCIHTSLQFHFVDKKETSKHAQIPDKRGSIHSN